MSISDPSAVVMTEVDRQGVAAGFLRLVGPEFCDLIATSAVQLAAGLRAQPRANRAASTTSELCRGLSSLLQGHAVRASGSGGGAYFLLYYFNAVYRHLSDEQRNVWRLRLADAPEHELGFLSLLCRLTIAHSFKARGHRFSFELPEGAQHDLEVYAGDERMAIVCSCVAAQPTSAYFGAAEEMLAALEARSHLVEPGQGLLATFRGHQGCSADDAEGSFRAAIDAWEQGRSALDCAWSIETLPVNLASGAVFARPVFKYRVSGAATAVGLSSSHDWRLDQQVRRVALDGMKRLPRAGRGLVILQVVGAGEADGALATCRRLMEEAVELRHAFQERVDQANGFAGLLFVDDFRLEEANNHVRINYAYDSTLSIHAADAAAVSEVFLREA